MRPLPPPSSQTFSFRTLGVILVLWGWFLYFEGSFRTLGLFLVLIGPQALDYDYVATFSGILTFLL